MRIPSRQAGFTLIELMVVLVIVGIASAAISLGSKPDPARQLRQDAKRLALLFDAARSEVMVDGRPIVWQADSQGYRFLRRIDARRDWETFDTDAQLRPRQWLAGPLKVRITPDRTIVLRAEWIGEPWQVVLSDGQSSIELLGAPDGRVQVR